MTDTTPAAELRAAATKLRRLTADFGTPSESFLIDDRDPEVLVSPTGAVFARAYAPVIADYMAAMGPGVGAALADWLDGTAATIEAVVRKHEDAASETSHWVAPALAVARQILGSQP